MTMEFGFEIEYSEDKEVTCDGSAQGVGHPLVYLNMGEKNEITCPYCSKNFVFKEKK